MFDFKKDSPESVGIPSRCLLKFLERLQKKQIPMHSFLLMRHDTLIAEGYYAPYQKDTLHRMFSISKSFTSIAIGLLEAEGKLSLDDPIVRYFPDKVPSNVHPWIAEMTIRDMLMMRTCHASTTYKHFLCTDTLCTRRTAFRNANARLPETKTVRSGIIKRVLYVDRSLWYLHGWQWSCCTSI